MLGSKLVITTTLLLGIAQAVFYFPQRHKTDPQMALLIE